MNKAEYLATNPEIGYDHLHSMLREKYGKANHCISCNGSKALRFEYALIKGREYSLNIEDYQQMCPSCHRKYDMTDKQRAQNRANGKAGEPKPGLMKPVIDGNGKIYQSASRASQETGISRTAIANCLSKRSKKAGKLKWSYHDKK